MNSYLYFALMLSLKLYGISKVTNALAGLYATSEHIVCCIVTSRDFRVPPRCKSDLRSSGMLTLRNIPEERRSHAT